MVCFVELTCGVFRKKDRNYCEHVLGGLYPNSSAVDPEHHWQGLFLLLNLFVRNSATNTKICL